MNIYVRLSLTGKLLNALLSGLSDRSASVRKSYATAIGHLVKVHSDKPFILLTTFLTFFMPLLERNLFLDNYLLVMTVVIKRTLLDLNLYLFVRQTFHAFFLGGEGQQRRKTY